MTLSDPGKLKRALLNDEFLEPTVFHGFINHWKAREWSPEYLANHDSLTRKELIFRVAETADREPANKCTRHFLWENESKYVSCSISEFMKFAERFPGCASNEKPHLDQSLHEWAYADYKHMCELFEHCPEMLTHIDWGVLGFDNRDGTSSTFWLGSAGAYTPCHYDTYGCNLVAQIYGRKKWILFPPSDTDKMYPTRTPFEESSVFSRVSIKNPCDSTTPKFSSAARYEVLLEPGQVLFVPKHWWHYVECESTAISVNTWIELSSDKVDNTTEALAAMLTKAFTDYSDLSADNVYNPKESPMEQEEGIKLLNTIKHNTRFDSDSSQDESKSDHMQETPATGSRENTCTPSCCKKSIHRLKPVNTVMLAASSKTVPPPNITSVKLLNAITHPDVLTLISKKLSENG